jgi:hypothetical protein
METVTGLPADSARLDARAFKKLYPDQYYDRFITARVRPDGRALAGFRPTTIGLRPVESSDASALVKLGRTTVLGSIKLEVIHMSHISAWLLAKAISCSEWADTNTCDED